MASTLICMTLNHRVVKRFTKIPYNTNFYVNVADVNLTERYLTWKRGKPAYMVNKLIQVY